MKRLRGVIFDYGNTLVRLDPTVRSTRTDYADVVAEPGAERLRSFLVRAGFLPAHAGDSFVERFLVVRDRNRKAAEAEGLEIPALRTLQETLLDLGLPVAPEVDLEQALEEFFAAEMELIRAMPGAGALLQTLQDRGIRTALLSNATSGRYVARAVTGLGWSGLFDPFVVSADTGFRKPRPETFRAILDRWGFDPGEIAMVGDSLYHDVGGALSLGMMTVHFTAIPNPYDAALANPPIPGFSVSSHEELRRVLLPDAD